LSSLKKSEHILPISLLTLSIFLTLFVFRFIDDNRLTSWAWIFKDTDAVKISLIVIFGTVIAYLFSGLSFPERNPAITLFLFSFIITLPFWGEPELIVDVTRYFTQAKHLEIYGIRYFFREWGRDIMAWTDMPLVPFLYGLIFKYIGESRVYIQTFTTILFSLTVFLTYKIGKTLWDEDTGFIAGSLLLGIPYIYTQVPLMLVDIPTMFFLMLSVFTFIKAMEKGGVLMSIFAAITMFFAIFSKYSTWPMLSVLVIIFLVYLKIPSLIYSSTSSETNPPSPPFTKGGMGGLEIAMKGKTFYRGIMIALISSLLSGLIFFSKFDVFSEQIKFLMTYQKPGLGTWSESFISTFLFQTHPFITAGALYSVYVALRKRDSRYLIVSWLFVLLVLFQIKRIRYTIPLFPMFALMASYGIRQIKGGEIRRFTVSSIVFVSLSLALFAYLPFTKKMSAVNLIEAGEFLDFLNTEEVEVFVQPAADSPVNPAVAVPVLDLFTRKKINYYYDPDSYQPPDDIKRSPLRFTWEYKNPQYYARGSRALEKNVPVVVISDDPDRSIPYDINQKIRGFQSYRVFKTSEGIFRYRTVVTVYYD
jgi:hypothetical protein